MKKIIIFFLLSLSFLNCSISQKLKVEDVSDNLDLNYILANIWTNSVNEELWNGGQYIKVFKMNDSKATPEGYFEGYDGVLESLLISAMPDGDYYTLSKLYKIVGILNPKIIEIKENNFPKFSVKIEHGPAKNRKTELIEFGGVQ